MDAVLVLLGALLGAVLTTTGWRAWRAAPLELDPATALSARPDGSFLASARRRAAVTAHAGMLVALLPAVWVLVGSHSLGVAALLAFHCWLVATGWALLSVGLLLTSAPVVLRAQRVARAVPRSLSWRRWRTTAGLPRDWAGLVARDRELSRTLLDHVEVTDLRVEHPVLADVTDPHTAAALEAMFECDRLRTAGPSPWRPARSSEYAAAVARFEHALAAAVRHSAQVNRSRVSRAERVATDRVVTSLTYLRENATTPAERQAAYAVLADELASLRAADETPASPPATPATAGPPPAQAHPWLDVVERAVRKA